MDDVTYPAPSFEEAVDQLWVDVHHLGFCDRRFRIPVTLEALSEDNRADEKRK